MGCNGCTINTDSDRPEMLSTTNWLKDLPDTSHLSNIVEVRFKGTHKDFFRNEDKLSIKVGDLIVVSSSPGHNVGKVSLTGTLAKKQFDRKTKNPAQHNWHKIYRKATETDIKKWKDAQSREQAVMVKSRQIAAELGLDMKIGDVEFQGDNTKAIFYYIANGRVDFRELIKRFASEFHIRIEMKQIGVRQEAGLLGSIGSCGRELCCSSWRTDFSSVTSEAAIKQGLSPNAEKMTGQCGKLKCCLMYELDTYLEAQEDFPYELLTLETDKGIAKHLKTEILNKKIWYTLDKSFDSRPIVLDLKDVKAIIQLNKRGKKPSLDNYIKIEEKIENEMSVGSVNIDFIKEKKVIKLKRKPQRRFSTKSKNTKR